MRALRQRGSARAEGNVNYGGVCLSKERASCAEGVRGFRTLFSHERARF